MDTTTILPNLQHDQQPSTNGCKTTTTTITTLNNQSKLINTTTTNPLLSKLKCVRKKKSYGKKDKQSKIHTAQGLRDRRMRLSVHTARKFFDLNDMLGFDKASKTIEWLFSKSHKAIQEVTETIQSDADAAVVQPVSMENNDIGKPVSECETESVMEQIMIKNCDDHNMKESSCYPVEVSETYHVLKHLHLDNITAIPTTDHALFDYNKTVAEPPACWLNSRNPVLGFHGGWNSENHRMKSNRIEPMNGNMNGDHLRVMSSFINFNSENQGQ